MKKFYICKVPHRDNQLKSDQHNNWVGHIGFTYAPKPKESNDVLVEIKKIVSFLYDTMSAFGN